MARIEKVNILKGGRFTVLHRTVGVKFSLQVVEPREAVIMRRVIGVVPGPFAQTDFVIMRRVHTIPSGAVSAAAISGEELQITYHVFSGPDFRESPEPPPVEFDTRYTGTAQLRTTNANAPSDSGPFNIRLGFLDGLSEVIVLSFLPIVTDEFETPAGPNRVSVKSLGSAVSGTFDPATGEMTLPLNLVFDNSNPIIPDSSLSLTMTTGSVTGIDGALLVGSPLNPTTRELTLVGVGDFQGGVLGNDRGDLRAVGSLQALPE